MWGNGSSPAKNGSYQQPPPQQQSYPCPYAHWTRPSDAYAPNFNGSQQLPPQNMINSPVVYGAYTNNHTNNMYHPNVPPKRVIFNPVYNRAPVNNQPSTSGPQPQKNIMNNQQQSFTAPDPNWHRIRSDSYERIVRKFDPLRIIEKKPPPTNNSREQKKLDLSGGWGIKEAQNAPSTSTMPNDYEQYEDSWDEEDESKPSTVPPSAGFQSYNEFWGVDEKEVSTEPSTSQKPDNSESDTTEEYAESGPEEDLSWDGDDSDEQPSFNPYEELDKEAEDRQRRRVPEDHPTTTGFLDYHFKSLGIGERPLTPEAPEELPQRLAPKPKKATAWTTREPIRHNLPVNGWESPVKVDKVVKKETNVREMHPDFLNRLRFNEEQRNVFSPFYFDTKTKKDRHRTPKHPQNYKHKDAINFAATSHTWTENWDHQYPILPRVPELVTSLPNSNPDEDVVCAFYRVLAEREHKYILIACHVNIHGYHRGDLRFIEVNARTQLDGFGDKSVIGNLFLGDIVAVTELARNSKAGHANMNATVSQVSQESPCYWIASKMILQPRDHIMPVTFSFLKNRMAVVKGDDEPMQVTVDNWNTVTTDLIYKGTAFKPMKLELNFTEDYGKQQKNNITTKATKISSYPNSFGTIFQYEECEDQNEQFEIGINAFSEVNDLSVEERERIVETCSLMGFSAANTIFNGRFDCRAFHMRQILKTGLIVKFRIDNPPYQPTLGLWNAGNRIMFGGPEGDMNATIETVISDDNTSLRITARLSREVPKSMNFKKGEFFVSQREITDHYFLHDRYFHDLEPQSNGRWIIETLYGADALQLVKIPSKHQQYYFPSFPHPIALNQYQNEYVQMLLDENPLIIGSSPFGCGKSMTIITAALEIYRRNCEKDIINCQRQQLLITQSNYASVNLIDIAQRICSSTHSELKFVRFVTEKNWNELPDNCRTDYDMPSLMNKVFIEWGTGRIDVSDPRARRLNPSHHNHMLAYILKNKLIDLAELAGGGRRTYDRYGTFKTPAASVITEAFFYLYQPDLIMTTADSSKNLLSVLTQVCTVQIDEASQLPEYTLLGLLKTFNRANFGLIGDIHQLPPYCEDTLDGKLKDYGIGNTMERAIHRKLFPISTLRFVYRCHPKITELLSELFYDGALLSGVTEDQRNDFVKKRRDFWPNPCYPMMIVNNEGASFKMGTSHGNDSEKELVKKLILNLIKHTTNPVNPQDIGVISFYAAQTSILTEYLRGTGVKCGTVDAFQGTEKEIIIVCCTRDTVSDFMQMSKRLNVAMSRAKQATIIIGNVEGLRKAQYWSRIVQKIEENRNLVHAANFNDHPPPRQPQYPVVQQTYQQPPQQQLSYAPRHPVNPQMSPNQGYQQMTEAPRQNFNNVAQYAAVYQMDNNRMGPPVNVKKPNFNQAPPPVVQKPNFLQNPPYQFRNQKSPEINPGLVAQLENLRAKENQRNNTQLQGRWSSNTFRAGDYHNN